MCHSLLLSLPNYSPLLPQFVPSLVFTPTVGFALLCLHFLQTHASLVYFAKMPEAWVILQHRTMARWISSKVTTLVTDVTKDLSDGLVLIELINKISAETECSSYRLTPVHKKPSFRLQKLENVDDALQYCRLVLKINTCTISAENVVEGNLKLVLGLIWSLFVYSSSRLISLSNEGTSIGEIKAILLAWVNDLGRRRAISHVSNFNKDWSLQQEMRPDLIFASILDFYAPNFVNYSEILEGKRVANLSMIITRAADELGIPRLAEAEDFNVLVPEEKCVIFYVLEWYLFFEVNAEPASAVESEALVRSGHSDVPDEAKLLDFIQLVLAAVKFRNRYETRSLRLLNCVNENINKIADMKHDFEANIKPAKLASMINKYCADLGAVSDFTEVLAQRNYFPHIYSTYSKFTSLLSSYEHFRLLLKPDYFYHDYPELQTLYKSVETNLKSAGIPNGYQPLKLLSLSALASRLSALDQADMELSRLIGPELEAICSSQIQSISLLIEALKSKLRSTKTVAESAKLYISSLDELQRFKSELANFSIRLQQKNTTSDLRAVIRSIETLDIPQTPDSPMDSQFVLFQEMALSQKNRSHLTFSDVRKFFKRILEPGAIGATDLNDFIQLIPTRRLLNRSESDDFSREYTLDDSDDANSIFDSVLKTLEHKLLGNYNKIFDLGLMVTKLENGFKV